MPNELLGTTKLPFHANNFLGLSYAVLFVGGTIWALWPDKFTLPVWAVVALGVEVSIVTYLFGRLAWEHLRSS